MRSGFATLGVAACAFSASGAGCEKASLPQPEFTILADPYPAGALFSAWASGPDDVWVAGGKTGAAVLLHFDGQRWQRNDPPLSEQLWWVHGFAGGPIFVAGSGGALARFDAGTGWTVLPSGHPGTTFYGIWGATASDLYAVGGPDFSGTAPEGDIILRGNGHSWARVRVAALDDKPASAQKDLFKVWGTSANDVFVVGGSGTILHFDGTSWIRQDAGIGNEPLFTVFGRGPRDVYAVGGLGSPIFLRYDGSTWRTIVLPNDAPPVLQGVWTAPGQPVWISGYYGFVAAWDGGAQFRVAPPRTQLAFHAVFGVGGAIYATGGNLAMLSGNLRGVLAVSGRQVPAP